MSNFAINAIWAFAAGALIPVMGSLNAGLSRSLGSATVAAVVLFAVALSATLVVFLASRDGLPTAAGIANAPALTFAGGLIVAFYVLSVTVLVPRFGVGNTILFAMTAQIVTSAVIDHAGLFGAPVRPVNAMRVAGLGLMICGLILAQVGATRSA
jgi:bacterial/archaeal transporter family-2 protein